MPLASTLNNSGDLVVYVDGAPVGVLSLNGSRLSLFRYGAEVGAIDTALAREVARHARFPDDAGVHLNIGTHCDPPAPFTMGDLRAALSRVEA